MAISSASGPVYANYGGRSTAAGLTASGFPALDALLSYARPVRRVQALSLQPHPNLLDALTVIFEFKHGINSTLAAIRSTAFFRRIHFFCTSGLVEALGENERVVRVKGQVPQCTTYEPVDVLAVERDAFADAAAGCAAYPISFEEIRATIAAIEAVLARVQSQQIFRL